MTREEVATKIRWQLIIWLMGFVNIAAMMPQLYKLITTRVTEGLSLSMIFIYLSVQIAFSLEGFFKRNTMLMVTLGLSALVSVIVIVFTLYLRHFA